MSGVLEFFGWLFNAARHAAGALRRLLPTPSPEVVRLRLDGSLAEGLPATPWFGLRFERRSYLLHVLELLDRASRDPRVRAVWIEPTGLRAGWATLQALRRGILDVRAKGKKVLVFLESAGNGVTYLASAADRVLMAPSGTMSLTGLRTEILFLRGTLDRARVEPEFLQLGEYKSSAETLTRSSLSPPAREALNAILDDLYDQIVSGIAEGRGLGPARVREFIDAAPHLAAQAVAHGLIDAARYEDEVEADLRVLLGATERPPSVVEARHYLRAARRLPPPPGTKLQCPRIALLIAQGMIRSGRVQPTPMGRGVASGTFVDALRKARDDRRIAAIVIRVNSPGGSSLASDLIWREVTLAREKKPVVVSMGDVAASGGYYLSMPADWIVAEGATLTGSIGVVAGKFNLRGLYDLLGIAKEALDRGAHAGAQSDYRPFTTEERAKLQEQMRSVYEDFVEKAAKGRGLDREKLDRVAQGRVWTGRQALAHGLVDELGGIQTAVAAAKRRAGIPFGQPVRMMVLPRPVPSFADLLPSSPLPRGLVDALDVAEALQSFHALEPLVLWPFLLLSS